MKRKSKVVEKPKRRRRKKPTENTLDGWAGIILKKKKRKRVRKNKGEMVICCNNKCWYDGPCPHKKPHRHTEDCENDFCSYMGIKTSCIKVKEGDK